EDGIRYRNVTGVQTCALPIYKGPILFTWVFRLCHGRAISKVSPLKTPVGKSEQLGTFWVLAHQLPAQEESWCLASQHLRRSIILSWTLPETPRNLMRVKLRAVPLCLLKSSHRGMTQIARKPKTYYRFSVAITRTTSR